MQWLWLKGATKVPRAAVSECETRDADRPNPKYEETISSFHELPNWFKPFLDSQASFKLSPEIW